MLKSDKYINDKLDSMTKDSYVVKSYDSIYHKIKLIRQLEENHDIDFLDVKFKTNDKIIKMDVSLYKKIKTVFRTIKAIPTTLYKLKQLYIMMLNNCYDGLLNKTKITTGEFRDSYEYSLNKDLIKYHAQILAFKEPKSHQYHDSAIKMLGIDKIKINTVNYDSIKKLSNERDSGLDLSVFFNNDPKYKSIHVYDLLPKNANITDYLNE
jgi:hypothetical protein